MRASRARWPRVAFPVPGHSPPSSFAERKLHQSMSRPLAQFRSDRLSLSMPLMRDTCCGLRARQDTRSCLIEFEMPINVLRGNSSAEFRIGRRPFASQHDVQHAISNVPLVMRWIPVVVHLHVGSTDRNRLRRDRVVAAEVKHRRRPPVRLRDANDLALPGFPCAQQAGAIDDLRERCVRRRDHDPQVNSEIARPPDQDAQIPERTVANAGRQTELPVRVVLCVARFDNTEHRFVVVAMRIQQFVVAVPAHDPAHGSKIEDPRIREQVGRRHFDGRTRKTGAPEIERLGAPMLQPIRRRAVGQRGQTRKLVVGAWGAAEHEEVDGQHDLLDLVRCNRMLEQRRVRRIDEPGYARL